MAGFAELVFEGFERLYHAQQMLWKQILMRFSDGSSQIKMEKVIWDEAE